MTTMMEHFKILIYTLGPISFITLLSSACLFPEIQLWLISILPPLLISLVGTAAGAALALYTNHLITVNNEKKISITNTNKSIFTMANNLDTLHDYKRQLDLDKWFENNHEHALKIIDLYKLGKFDELKEYASEIHLQLTYIHTPMQIKDPDLNKVDFLFNSKNANKALESCSHAHRHANIVSYLIDDYNSKTNELVSSAMNTQGHHAMFEQSKMIIWCHAVIDIKSNLAMAIKETLRACQELHTLSKEKYPNNLILNVALKPHLR